MHAGEAWHRPESTQLPEGVLPHHPGLENRSQAILARRGFRTGALATKHMLLLNAITPQGDYLEGAVKDGRTKDNMNQKGGASARPGSKTGRARGTYPLYPKVWGNWGKLGLTGGFLSSL